MEKAGQLISLLIDAAIGATCKPGDLIRKGHYIGKIPGSGNRPVIAPCQAVVRSIVFHDEKHVLEILIEPVKWGGYDEP